MRAKRLFVVAFIVGAASFGIPTQVSAAPSIPRSLTAVRTVLSQVAPGQSKTISVRMPWRANMIGLSYVDATHSENGVSIVARAHTAGGWSGWEEIGGDDNGAMGVEARHDTSRLTTEALWVGTADHVQVTVSVARTAQTIHNVRVHLINTLGDSTPQNFVVRALHAIGRFLSMRPSTGGTPAQAQTSQPSIITRAQWGANPAYLNLPCPGVAPDLKMAFVHHTDTTNGYTKSQSAGIVRGIYAYHTNTRGYCDIAYNFLIDKYGQIFEGRNGGVTNNVIGAHTGGYNYESVGVALLGNYSNARPTSAMMTALSRLLAWRLDIAHVPATGYVYMTTGAGNDHTKAGTIVKFNRIAGHRDASLSNCPGNYVYSLMTKLRSAAKSIGLPKIYLPQTDRTVLRHDGDYVNDAVRFAAGFSGAVTWTLKYIDPTGTVQRTFTGTGTSVGQWWDGTTADGSMAPSGLYTWRLDAHDSTNHSATSATGRLNVVAAHPDGTLLSDATGKYVIDGGAARPVDSVSYTSNFGSIAAIPTGPFERSRYTTGAPLGLREGTLLSDTSTSPATNYIWSDGALHAFGEGAFAALGYVSAAAIPVDASYIASLGTLGDAVTSVTQHPDGTLVKSLDGKSFWVVQAGTLRPISALARASWYRSNEAVSVAAGDPTTIGTAFPVRDGTYIRSTDGGAPWLVSDGTRDRFVSLDFASAMGSTSAMLLTASSTDINAIPAGPRIG